jgi:hypothetical protein
VSLNIFWVVARRQFLVYDQRFGNTCLSHLQGLPKTQKILRNITTTAEAFNYITSVYYTGHTQKNGAVFVYSLLITHHSFVYALYIQYYTIKFITGAV